MDYSESVSKINFHKIESKWRLRWNTENLFVCNPDYNKENKYFITVAFPYPNSPQHIGHGRTYTLADVHARYMRMKGNTVLFPMGFHYTGTPILAMSKRVMSGDVDLIDNFKNIYNVPEDIIKTFSNPEKIAKYFHKEIKLGMQEMGYSIDWTREFTTIDKLFSKFVVWQFNTLKKNGLIVQGSHPVGWCPRDDNPVSQHDTLGDVEPEFNEYTLIKFKLLNKNIFLPVATLRPETIFGVTNLWINPNIDYLEIDIDNERWIVTRESYQKLGFLNHDIKLLNTIPGKDLIGKYVINPVGEIKIQIFPAKFVKSDAGTGIVMSVPGHAPYDYQAIMDLKKDKKIKTSFPNLELETVHPIKIIEVKEYNPTESQSNTSQILYKNNVNGNEDLKTPSSSDVSVETVISKYGITSQMDEALERATTELYHIEYYKGKMLSNTGSYFAKDVKDAKDDIKQKLLSKKIAEIFYEFVKIPKCRCGSECVVKLLNDQWFINYGDPKWKEKVHQYLDSISILPEELRQEFHNVVDWLKERACARKSGLGTKFPWDQEWIIESLSDSVVYMAYYIIAKFVNNDKYSLNKYIENINGSFFDYIFLGLGNIYDIEKQCKVDNSLISKIRKEFLYFYPVDSRHSGRDLVPNHLSFFIFNHIAIFDQKYWPKQIVINGSVLMDGKKMSKSIGNIIPIRKAIQNYGADTIRLSILISAELLQDADFSFETAKSIRSKLIELYYQSIELQNSSLLEKKIQGFKNFQPTPANKTFEDILYSYIDNKSEFLQIEDKWMMNKLQKLIHDVTESMDSLRVREVLHNLLFVFEQEIQRYKKRSSSRERKNNHSIVDAMLLLCLSLRIKMLSPFAPYITEEIWEKFGNINSITLTTWPFFQKEKVDPFAEESEKYINTLIYDINKIIKVTKKTPNTIYIYCSSIIKKIIYQKILRLISIDNQRDFGDIIKKLIEDPNTNEAKRYPSLVKKIIEDILSVSPDSRTNLMNIDLFNESYVIEDCKKLLANEITTNNKSVKIIVSSEDDQNIYDPKERSKFSRPFKPAIYLE
ncbi:MAG: leucine--tRNA ligase [Nitrososphaeraceae archaeon]|nr:leucine--tRNA ligase [Nitrososphaeraceae archaeon]